MPTASFQFWFSTGTFWHVYRAVIHTTAKSLWPSDIIWRHKSGSTFTQAMTSCPTVQSHHLTQCWLIINCVFCGIHMRAFSHYSDVVMSAIASQIIGISSVCCSGPNQRKHQSSATLAFVRGINRSPVDSPYKEPVTQEKVSFWWRHHNKNSTNLTCVQRLHYNNHISKGSTNHKQGNIIVCVNHTKTLWSYRGTLYNELRLCCLWLCMTDHYTPAQRSWRGGILDSPCPSVCPSVRLSVRLSVDDMVSGA